MGPADPPPDVRIEVGSATATSLTVTVSWGPSVARGTAVTGYRIAVSTGAANAGGVVSPATTSAQYVLGCAGDCRYTNASITASVTAESQSGDSVASTAGYEHVGGPAPQPANGDVVVTNYLEEPSCLRLDQSCRILRYQYTAILNPPEAWRQFAGSCRLVIVGPSGTTYQSIGCAATSAFLFNGNGSTYSVSAQACGATCVTSSPLTIYTIPPEQIWCGEYLC
jgi:hypothetical protein